MAGKLRAIVKRTDEPYGHVCNISGSLENLQKIVGGYIETVPVGRKHVLIVNEEGKLRSLPINFHMGRYDTIVGDAIVLGVHGDAGQLPAHLPATRQLSPVVKIFL